MASVVLFGVSDGARADIYWGVTGSGGIGHAALDGNGADWNFVDNSGTCGAGRLAAYGLHLYWTNMGQCGIPGASGAIGRSNLNGTGADANFINVPGLEGPGGLAVEGNYIYWTNCGSCTTAGAIARANLDGTHVNLNFITGLACPGPMAVDAQHLYWVNGCFNQTVGRASLNGSGANRSFITGVISGAGLAVDSHHIYWTNANYCTGGSCNPKFTNEVPGSIGRADLNGAAVNQTFISDPAWRCPAFGACSPQGLAVDAAFLYWSNGVVTEGGGCTAAAGCDTIARAKPDGTGVNKAFIPPPSNTLQAAGALTLGQRAGTRVTLRSSVNPSVVGQKVTYTATVSPPPLGGFVRFTDGGAVVPGCGNVRLVASNPLSSVALCHVRYSAPGSHLLVATYSGSGTFAGSQSPTLKQVVRGVR